MPSDDLHKPLKSINKSIAKLREDIQKLIGEVKKIHTVIQEAAETIRDAIHENIRAQAELKLMEHMMEVRSVKPQISAEHDQIRTEREELEERLESIGERYERQHEELNQKARERIRNLGEHIFEIEEEQFEENIEEPFTEQVTTAWQTLRSHNEKVHEERTERVRESAGETVQSIHDFVDRQDALVEAIQNHRLDPERVSLSGEQPDWLQIPYYVVEYEIDDVPQREVVVPSTLSADVNAEWCQVRLEPMPGAEELLDGVSNVDTPTHIESLSGDDLADELEKYGETSPLAPTYGEALAEAFPAEGSIPVRLAGGQE